MTVYGKLIERYSCDPYGLSEGGYMAFKVSDASVKTTNGKPINDNSECFVLITSPVHSTYIKKIDKSYLSADEANDLIKKIATEKIISLDDFNMGFVSYFNDTPKCVQVMNITDDVDNPIPLVVTKE